MGIFPSKRYGTSRPVIGQLWNPLIYRLWNRWVFALAGQFVLLRYNSLGAVIATDPGKKD
jgi:hypothetical protein